MRLIPALTAILVVLFLYGIVFERDTLLAYARGEDSTEQVSAEAQLEIAEVSDSPQAPVIRVVAVHSKAQTVDSVVILRGQTQALREVEVRAETSAVVMSPPLRKGTFVTAGDVMCKLDPGTRDANLAEARARLSEAKSRVPETKARLQEAFARLEEAKINNKAAAKLSKGGYTTETRLISTRASMRAAEAGIASAESGLETTKSGIEAAAATVAAAERQIDQLTIKAPFDGLLETDTAELGSLMQLGTLCGVVIQLDPIKLIGYVPETEINRVKVGVMAGAELASGRRVQGQVTFLSRSADPTTRTFLVEISVPNPDLEIRDGQTATIGIAADGAQAHRLPQSALTLNNNGQLGVRVVGEDNIVLFNPVDLMLDDIDGIWAKGLPDEVDVIVVGQDFVTEGVRVLPTFQEINQ